MHRVAFTKCLIHHILPIIAHVMINQFGNYLCQRIMEEAEVSDIKKIVDEIHDKLVDIALNVHGTRVIQILITRLSEPILENIQRYEHVILQAETAANS